MVGHWGSSAGLYLADPTSPIPCYGTFCRPLHNLSLATNCIYAGGTFRRPHAQFDVWRQNVLQWYIPLGRQNVPCKSAYFVVPHRMDLNIHSDIYLLNMMEAIYCIL